MDYEEVVRFKDNDFYKLDTNCDGWLNPDELRTAVAKDKLKGLSAEFRELLEFDIASAVKSKVYGHPIARFKYDDWWPVGITRNDLAGLSTVLSYPELQIVEGIGGSQLGSFKGEMKPQNPEEFKAVCAKFEAALALTDNEHVYTQGISELPLMLRERCKQLNDAISKKLTLQQDLRLSYAILLNHWGHDHNDERAKSRAADVLRETIDLFWFYGGKVELDVYLKQAQTNVRLPHKVFRGSGAEDRDAAELVTAAMTAMKIHSENWWNPGEYSDYAVRMIADALDRDELGTSKRLAEELKKLYWGRNTLSLVISEARRIQSRRK